MSEWTAELSPMGGTCIMGEDGAMVAKLTNVSPGAARLILNAPELLQALKDLLAERNALKSALEAWALDLKQSGCISIASIKEARAALNHQASEPAKSAIAQAEGGK